MKAISLRTCTLLILTLAVGLTGCKKAEAIHPKQHRFKWNLATLVTPYDHAGYANPKWNAPARRALTEFARGRADLVPPDETFTQIISTNTATAVQAGCQDPLVNYLYLRFAMSQTNSKVAFTKAFVAMAQRMNRSDYPPVRKFYAAVRTQQQINFTYGTNSFKQPFTAGIADMINKNLAATLQNPRLPAEEAFEVANTAFDFVYYPGNIERLYQCVAQPLFKNWPKASSSWLLKGNVYLKLAWACRGGGYAYKVKAQGWKEFYQDLAVAAAAFQKAWQLNPRDERIPIQMIRVAEGEQKSRAFMNRWFQRAMAIDPDCYQACLNKLHYLYPQWYGSRAAMIAFGRQCVASPIWGGKVPLILAEAHWEYWLYLNNQTEKSNYWRRPDVWPDIKASYTKFFKLNPQATSYYKNYAWYAYKCRQWQALSQLLPRLKPADYDYFGGETNFNQMVKQTREHVGQ